jgi:hypothetical protein
MSESENLEKETEDLFYAAEELDEETTKTKNELEEGEEVKTDEAIENASPDEKQIYQIEGDDVELETILKWKNGHMMHSDYSKKTALTAEERKAINVKSAELDDRLAELKVLVDEADKSTDWDELRDLDPSEYLKQKELQDARKEAIEKAKSAKVEDAPDSPEFVKEQQDILIEKNPEWLDKDGNQTDVHTKDMKNLAEYLSDNDYTAEDQSKIRTAKQWQVLLDASKYKQSLKNIAEVKKKLKKVPVSNKSSKEENTAKSTVELFYGNN